MSRLTRRFGPAVAGIFLVLFLAVFAASGYAQGSVLSGTARAPKVGDKAPAFDLEGFDLKKQIEGGSLILVFYRGYF
jgi:hypothetical protein